MKENFRNSNILVIGGDYGGDDDENVRDELDQLEEHTAN